MKNLSINLKGAIKANPAGENAGHSMTASNTSTSQNIYIRLYKSLGASKKIWNIYLFSAVFAATTTQLTVFINQILIDNVLPSFQLNTLIVFAIGVGLFKLLDVIIYQYKHFVGIHVGNILDKYFLTAFDQKLNTFSTFYTQSYRRGDLTERLSDSLKLKRFFVRVFTRFLVDIFVAAYSFLILFMINAKLSMIVLVVLVLFYFWFKFITPALKKNEKKRFQRKADTFSKMIEKIDGLQVIKSFNIDNLSTKKIGDSIDKLIKTQTKVQYISLLNEAVISMVTLIASLLIIVFLAKESILFQNISLGQIVIFILLSEKVFASVSKLMKENLTIQEHEVILNRFFNFDDKNASQNKLNGGIENFHLDDLSLKSISFQYAQNKMVLENLDLSIKQNEKIRLTGKNGSGKTTLAKLICQLYSPSNGYIEINNTARQFYCHNNLMEKTLLVSNEDILFNESIMFNLTLGKDVAVDRLIQLAKEIDLYDMIAEAENGLDFMISEGGKNLSTGQRKKILILRALVSDATLIVFDEVLSGLDKESRIKIETSINKLNKTIVIISHEEIENIQFTNQYQITNGKLIQL